MSDQNESIKQWAENGSRQLGDTLRRLSGQGDDKNHNWLLYLVLGFALVFLWQGIMATHDSEIPYSEFIQKVNAGQVEQVLVSEQAIVGNLTPEAGETQGKPFVTVPLWNSELVKTLEQHNVKYTVRQGGGWFSNFVFVWLLPMLILFALWGWMARRMTGGGFFGLGKRRTPLEAGDLQQTTFNDVAGAEEAKQELMETIDFLRDPTHIQRLGGRMPKGVLLVGAPGTGKTLLARAVAGEAKVPFFNIGGSEFIELFVGVGASRVRDLFEQARQKAPCIIFIDELDAIGRSRGGPVVMGGHDEREQTLNQLLTEMDGFDASSGVVVMAATNRPEILDKALLRAGRFDRQIVVDKPGLADRVAILKLHTQNIKLAKNLDLGIIAQRTPGFVGADLANIANEAAILAVRDNQEDVTLQNFEAAIDRIIAGPEKKSRALSEAEKRRVAYHESGHALVAKQVPTGEPVHKISIIPRGGMALGYTLQLPVEEKFLSTEPELKDRIAILLGGRVAEEIALGDVSSGAQNDLEKASEIAHAMVCELGMSRKLGPLTYGRRQKLQYLGTEGMEERNFSDDTARLIDAEVRELVEEGYRRAKDILAAQRATLDHLAQRLQECEVLSGEELKQLLM
ncbi:MAG: ATP-dependent metallopeptidase FtsH/Yme1/Tma family protein [Methylococcaceae bacterium]|nr:MAG: ATP-dependent metallopeptidase FtsH/Yme1/Tma family protein [Methylococcaceae bacterium]